MMKDLYGILGVGKGAKLSEIKRAYHKLSKEHHPDKNGGTDDGFMAELNLAYHILCDPEKRRSYDETGYYGESHVMTIEEESLQLLGHLVSDLYQHYDGWLPYIDIVGELRGSLEFSRENCERDKNHAEKELADLERMAEILKGSLLAEMILSLAHGPEQQIAKAQRFLAVSQKTLEYIEEFNYRPKEVPKELQEEFEEFLHPKAPEGLGMMGLFEQLAGGAKAKKR